jgi:hypothetical protein
MNMSKNFEKHVGTTTSSFMNRTFVAFSLAALAFGGQVSAQPTPAQPGSTQPGSTQPGSTQPGSTQPGSTQPGSAQPSPKQPSRSASSTDCKPEQTAVSREAVLAIYYDKDGKRIPKNAEDLKGVKGRCITEAQADVSQDCPPGFREITIGGVKYCVRA